MRAMSVVLLCSAAACAATGQVLFKRGADGGRSFGDFLNHFVVTGLVLYGIGTALWIAALAREPLTVAYAFTALTFVLVYGASILVLKEPLTTSGAVGVVVVLVGLYLIAAGHR